MSGKEMNCLPKMWPWLFLKGRRSLDLWRGRAAVVLSHLHSFGSALKGFSSMNWLKLKKAWKGRWGDESLFLSLSLSFSLFLSLSLSFSLSLSLSLSLSFSFGPVRATVVSYENIFFPSKLSQEVRGLFSHLNSFVFNESPLAAF